eukprot:m.74064 g.74064  ORF g.74064 m.74064 type:complete len:62 (-) comp50326_c1_seq1:223-408(-)
MERGWSALSNAYLSLTQGFYRESLAPRAPNQNAINAKLHRERVKAEKIRMELRCFAFPLAS